MKFPDFSYARPATISEAIKLLSGNDDARPLAGGQSLLPMMALRMASPGLLVDRDPRPSRAGPLCCAKRCIMSRTKL
jgi:CO/xanthine dehydrogenase FAD-binding subunit